MGWSVLMMAVICSALDIRTAQRSCLSLMVGLRCDEWVHVHDLRPVHDLCPRLFELC